MTIAVQDRVTRRDRRVMLTMNGGRWIGFAGFAYIAAWLIGLSISFATSSPAPTDSIRTIADYYVHHRQAAMITAYLVDGLAGAALLIFAAGLRSAFRRLDGESDAVSNILFGAGVAAASISLLQGLFTQVLADRVAALDDPGATRVLFDLNGEADTYKLLALGIFIAATSLGALRTRALPRWLGAMCVVLSPALVVAGWSFALSPSTQYAAYAVLLVGLLAWVTAMSAASFRRAT